MNSKTCSRCKNEKPAEDFSKRKASPDGLQAWCNQCVAENNRAWRAARPEKRAEQSARNNERQKRKYATDLAFRETLKARGKARLAAETPEQRQARKARDRNWRLQRDYGLTQADYDRMYVERNGCCDLCGQRKKKLVIDHDHATGAMRGLLCTACNSALGKLGDTEESLMRAARYAGGKPAFAPFTFVA